MATDRKSRLQEFVDWAAAHITGDEKGEAQIFLDRLFQAFGQKGLLEVGGTARVPHPQSQRRRRRHRLRRLRLEADRPDRNEETRHRPQPHLPPGLRLLDPPRPRPPQYVVLCNFDEFWVYDFDVQLDEPMDRVKLAELPDRSRLFVWRFLFDFGRSVRNGRRARKLQYASVPGDT